MKWIEVRAEYQEKEGLLVAELVADAFFETGFSGVAVYDGRIKTEDDWAEGVLPEDGPPHVDGYFPEDGGFAEDSPILKSAWRSWNAIPGSGLHCSGAAGTNPSGPRPGSGISIPCVSGIVWWSNPPGKNLRRDSMT